MNVNSIIFKNPYAVTLPEHLNESWKYCPLNPELHHFVHFMKQFISYRFAVQFYLQENV